MLGRQLPPGAGGYPDHDGHVELPAGHVRDRRRVVDDLVERQQAEVDRHDLDDRSHAAHRGADAGADECGLGQRRVADAFLTELVEQSLAHSEAAPVLADVFAHQEDAGIVTQRLAEGALHRLAVGDPLRSRGRHAATSR